MGACFSCCCPDADQQGKRSSGGLSQKDAEARARAAEAAAARQQQFEQGPYGRAVKKQYENARKEREAEAERRQNARADHARDWLS